MTTATATSPATGAYPAITAAEDLLPLLREHQAWEEEHHRLAPEVVEAAGKAGLFRLLAPSEMGGYAASLTVLAGVVETLATVSPSLCWYLGNSPPALFAAARLSESERAPILEEPDRMYGFCAVSSAARAQAIGGGFHLSGEWPLVTGVRDSRWCLLYTRIWDEAGPAEVKGHPDIRGFLVPTEALTIDPTWDRAAAMRGTGSHRVTADAIHLEAWAAVSPFAPLVVETPVLRIGASAIAAVQVRATASGILRGAVDHIAADFADRVSRITGEAATSNVALLEMLNDADQTQRAVSASLIAATSALDAATVGGGRGPDELRAVLYGGLHHTVRVAREAVSELYGRSSTDAFFEGHPLERALRDIHAVHFGVERIRSLSHSAALVLMGQKPRAPMF